MYHYLFVQMEAEHCMLLAVPHGRDPFDFLQQQNSLRNGIINYLIMKQAAGIVNVSAPGTHQVSERDSSLMASLHKNYCHPQLMSFFLFIGFLVHEGFYGTLYITCWEIG